MYYTKIPNPENSIFSFVKSAYACDPALPKPTQLIQLIQSVTITSGSSVFFQGKEYPHGKNLNELFKATYYLCSNDRTTIDDFIRHQQNFPYIFGYSGAGVVFQLATTPDSTINQTFTFLFEFSDAAKLSVQTPPFKVNNAY